jgi:PAS domain S-box-containing protein
MTIEDEIPHSLDEIIQRHGLDALLPPKVLGEIRKLCTDYETKLAETKQHMDLGYQEMQKVWELIQLRESFIKSIFNASQDMILTLDEQGQVIESNHVTEKNLGMNREEISGRPIFELLKGGTLLKDLNEFFPVKSEELEGSKFLNNSFEANIVNLKGLEFPVSVYASKVENGNGVVFPLYLRDLTQMKEAERALEESRAQVMSASKMSALGEMAGGLAHEINTPLAVIQMRADHIGELLLEEEIDRETMAKALNAVDLTVKRISKIVNGLRTFSRDGARDPKNFCMISAIVEDTFSMCREKFSNHGVHLEYQPHDEIGLMCRPSEIAQVLLNIINNAYDAIQNNSEKWVRVETYLSDSEKGISITDSGNGIPEEVRKRMMQPFFTTKEIGKGTGLGLSISKGLIEAHGGRLKIDAECKNTRFLILFPLEADSKGEQHAIE